jgi:alkylation response protein AidB-like acyl-CoA dehydrogenase
MTIERFATEALTPDEAESAAAEKFSRELARQLAQGGAVSVILSGDESGTQYPLPAMVAKLLVKILSEIAKGNAVAVVTLKPDRRANLRELVALNQEMGLYD